MAALDDQLAAEEAPSWHPHKTPEHDRLLKGTLLTRGVFHGDYGDSPIHTIDRGEDAPDAKPAGRFVNFFVFGAVAEGNDSEKAPVVGEQIAWLFKGVDTVKAGANRGKEYPVFKLFVDRDGASPSRPAPEPDLPFDEAGLPPRPSEPSIQDRAEDAFGDDPAF